MIFGVLITLLLAVALVAGAMWTGVLPSPLARPFSTPEAADNAAGDVPCPPPDALPVAFGEISVNVYNGTTRGGLAATTGSQLAQHGVVIASQDNFPGGTYAGVARVVSGPTGLTAAYTVAALIPESVVSVDASRADATVDVVLGEGFEQVLAPDAAPIDPSVPLLAPAGCTPVSAPAAEG